MPRQADIASQLHPNAVPSILNRRYMMNSTLKHSLVTVALALSFSAYAEAEGDSFPLQVAYYPAPATDSTPNCGEEAKNAWFLSQMAQTDGNVEPPQPPSQCPERTDLASSHGK